MTLWGGSGTFCGFPWQILFTVGVSRSQALLTQRDSRPQGLRVFLGGFVQPVPGGNLPIFPCSCTHPGCNHRDSLQITPRPCAQGGKGM